MTGVVKAVKDSVDFVESITCQNDVCAVISAVGVAVDSLQFYAMLIPGPNVPSVVTMSVSVGYKLFVWCCKKSKLPWAGCST